MNMPMEELRALLNREGISTWNWILADPSFETVSEAWVIENWHWWLEARPDELVIFGYSGGKRVKQRPGWIDKSSDCDNMALGTLAHAQVGNALSAVKTGTDRGGLAYGMVFYTAGPARPENFGVSGAHAINWWVDHDYKLNFFEPAMGKVVLLNSDERGTALFGISV